MNIYDGLLLASGGMDSTVLAYELEKEDKNLIILFIDYDQHCEKKEFETLLEVIPLKYKDNIKIIKIGDVYRESHSRMIVEANLWEDTMVAEDMYLPYRNILFISLAAAYSQSMGIKDVYTVFINSNHAKEIDCSMEFFTKLENLLGAPIEKTYSCQVNSVTPCGACPNCVDRLTAINNVLGEQNNG